MRHWAFDAIFYHIYPLGFCGAPEHNDFQGSPVGRLEKLFGWLDHLESLGINALYLGPLFESSAHGYDTADYYRVDRRLGTDDTLAAVSVALKNRGIRLILDGVFNHVGREFWAFQDLRERGERSAYGDWFEGISFDGPSPYGDPFTYQGWEGHLDLVKLNLRNPAVKQHLLEAAASWMRKFDIDGLRLDVAYLLDREFLEELGRTCRSLKPDFWLLGEVIHGDYSRWAGSGPLDSVTNYECYKGLYSSHNDRNYFEIAYSLNRQFGSGGIYRDLLLYTFADNHDVNRVASSLHEPAHLYPLYCLLLAMPGVPSIYYGSEWGIRGRRTDHGDRQLRPSLDLERAPREAPHPELADAIARLARLRSGLPALRYGDYRQLAVRHEQLVFMRHCGGQGSGAARSAVVAVNAAGRSVGLEVPLPGVAAGIKGPWRDLLNPPDSFSASGEKLLLELPPRWARILVA